MDTDQRSAFLAELARAGGAANLRRAGEALGMGRETAEDLAAELMAEGLLEMVSLSGGVLLTPAGREALAPAAGEAAGGLAGLLAELEALAPAPGGDFGADLACLKAQLGRSTPLGPVLAACLAALAAGLEAVGDPRRAGLAARARALAAELA